MQFRENWLIFLGIWGEAKLILRIWGAKEKYFQGAEEFWEISALFSYAVELMYCMTTHSGVAQNRKKMKEKLLVGPLSFVRENSVYLTPQK